MMKQHLKHFENEFRMHLFDYLMLITAGIFFLIAISIFKGERLIEFIILLAFASFYIIWGLYHHAIRDSIHLKNVLEYILIGFIAIFILKIIIFP